MSIEVSTIVIFAGALILAAGSPGPSIVALVSHVMARGWRDALPFAAAMWVGEVIWLSAAVFGLAALAQTLHFAFVFLKYLGVAYLLYLAWKMWFAPVDFSRDGHTDAPTGTPVRVFFGGFTVTMGNPKIMVFYLALLPNIVDLPSIDVGGWVALSLTVMVVLAAIDLTYMVLASRARRFLTRPSAARIAKRISALCMGGAAVTIAAK